MKRRFRPDAGLRVLVLGGGLLAGACILPASNHDAGSAGRDTAVIDSGPGQPDRPVVGPVEAGVDAGVDANADVDPDAFPAIGIP